MNKDLERYHFRIRIERDALELAMYDTKGVTEEGLANVPYILNTLQIRYERSCYFHTIRNTVVTLFNKLNKKYDLVEGEE